MECLYIVVVGVEASLIRSELGLQDYTFITELVEAFDTLDIAGVAVELYNGVRIEGSWAPR